MAVVLFSPRRVTLTAQNPVLQSLDIGIPEQATVIEVRLRRPTTAVPQNWSASATVRVVLSVTVGLETFSMTGSATGGVRTDSRGIDIPEYVIRFGLPIVNRGGVIRRIGELSLVRTARVRLERLRGTIDTQLTVAQVEEAASPLRTDGSRL